MKQKKNICITINALVMGGAEKQSVLLAQALKPFHNVILVVVDPTKEVYAPRLKTIQEEGIETIFLPKSIFGKTQVLFKLFKKKKIEYTFSFLATDTVLSAIVGKLSGVKYRIGGIRSSSWPKWKFRALKATHNYLLDYTIANNYAGYQVAIDFGFTPKIFVIPNGIEIRELHEKADDADQIKMISLGRLALPKRYDIAIQTIAHLKTIIHENISLKYTIVGQGPEYDSILEQIKKHDVKEEIDVVTDATDMYAMLDTANIYLCTSSFEGISNALMEAMNCAMPIIATDVGDNSRLVLDTKNGFLAEVNDYKNLAQKVKQLIENPQLRAEMGKHSYTHLIDNFSFEAFQKKYLDFIANIDDVAIKDGDFEIKGKA
ncbi:glycosyltransferase family 4 protein [Maribacter algarum]|uniref:Glycosyltransferase family 4 protein n=1 Tax=Maribacter algarum (ex Zhang et al. 2020) TaxID=2578118 RepID=A0A5S3PTE0_9FLAO|nr:glycosyltransferase family 4 protein [Maribacter algarum]TMM58223.1 glycosyltransferase family 4 protein [Maribacter algarum]